MVLLPGRLDLDAAYNRTSVGYSHHTYCRDGHQLHNSLHHEFYWSPTESDTFAELVLHRPTRNTEGLNSSARSLECTLMLPTLPLRIDSTTNTKRPQQPKQFAVATKGMDTSSCQKDDTIGKVVAGGGEKVYKP